MHSDVCVLGCAKPNTKKGNGLMKRLAVLIVAALVLTGLDAGYAQCGGSCPLAGAAAKACPSGCDVCTAAMGKLDLTDEQKAKIATLKEECAKIGCPLTSRAKFSSGLKEILTPKQLAQVTAACKKAGAKNCPLTSPGGSCR